MNKIMSEKINLIVMKLQNKIGVIRTYSNKIIWESIFFQSCSQ